MFSKKYFKIKFTSILRSIIFVLLSLVLSCGLKVGEAVPKTEVVELKNTKCLNESIRILKNFFDGDATDKEVDSSFKCISQVLLAFKSNVNGADRNFFAPEELAYFIETHFLKGEYGFKSELLAEIMNLKFVLLGGSSQVFYKQDIENLALMIDRLRPEIVKMNSQMKIISSKWDTANLSEAQKEQKFIEAKKLSLHFFEVLSQEFSRTGNQYEADHFLNLIKEIAIFANSQNSTIDKIEKARPFLISFKKNLVGEGTQIQSEDWVKISRSLHEMLFQILRIKYFLSPLNDQQIDQKWVIYEKITEDVFQLISTLLEAQKKPELTNQQVYELISSVLPVFTERTIDQDLIDGLADIKVALIGKGASRGTVWVPSDLNQITMKLPMLFLNIRKIQASMDALQLKNIVWSHTYADFLKIESDFNTSAQDLISAFDGEYNLDSLKIFLLSLQKNNMLPGFDLPKNFESTYKLLTSAKMLITDSKDTSLTNSELRQSVKIGAAGFFHYLEYNNYIKPYAMPDQKMFSGLDNVLPKINATVQNILVFKKSKMITTSEFVDLFSVLKAENIYETNIKSSTFGTLLDVVWSNILIEPEHRLLGLRLQGLDYEALHTLMTEAQLFIQSGKDLSEIFKTDTALFQAEIQDRINRTLLISTNPNQQITLAELSRVISGPIPMVRDSNKFLKFFEPQVQFAMSDVFQIQISKTLSRLLIRSFSNDLTSVHNLLGITLPEAQGFFDSIKDLFFDLDLIASTNTTFISSRFRESNLFVAHANGDSLANFEELSDLMMHVFSGLERAGVLRAGALTACLPPINATASTETAISEDCLLQYYFDTSHGFESMSQFLNMKTIFTEVQNKSYYMSLLKAAGHVPNDLKVVYFADADLFPHVLQYVEVIFLKYDANQDGFLNKEEALAAYPVFRSTIKEMLKLIPKGDLITEEQLPGVFTYLLKFGRPPVTGAEKLKFAGWIIDEKRWVIQSSRLDLGVIFNFIADSVSKL